MLVGVVGSVRQGNYAALPIVFTALAICGLAIAAKHFQIRLMLRDTTPDRIIRHYHQGVRRMPHAQAAAAYLSALAAAFFGQYDRAREELDAVEWATTSPMYRGHSLYVLAFLALLEQTDYPKALRLADEARELEKQDAAGGLPVLDDVIRLVAAGPSDEIITRLEKVAKKQHGLMPGMCAWALAVHYKRTNQPEKAANFKELLRLSVPHSAPLKA
jgi:tetratricopeptide (TPR) repeat protein